VFESGGLRWMLGSKKGEEAIEFFNVLHLDPSHCITDHSYNTTVYIIALHVSAL
jgi:hypothetical protein